MAQHLKRLKLAERNYQAICDAPRFTRVMFEQKGWQNFKFSSRMKYDVMKTLFARKNERRKAGKLAGELGDRRRNPM